MRYQIILLLGMICLVISSCQGNPDMSTVLVASEVPTVLVYGKALGEEPGEPYQFPSAGKIVDGHIYVKCSGIGHEDSVNRYENENLCFISQNRGTGKD